MSVQFGICNLDGQPLSPGYLEKVDSALAPYGPDSQESYSKHGTNIRYRAFCTTKESWREKQPHVSPSGVVVTWDGRLDSRAELVRELHESVNSESTDVAIVAAAYEKWGDKCLSRLVGDWALSVWNPRERSVLLAKDPIGTRQLYYSFGDNEIAWSTILDPLVLSAGKTFTICEEYLAGWLSVHPAAHLTPFVGIQAVPPSCSVLLRPAKHGVKHIVTKYWDFDPAKRIQYRADADYEEHFRAVFGEAVRRRLRSDRPVLAELSGGMDSSSIVCMADHVTARGQAECPRLDTISWFDDSYDHLEPDTNELHWISKVEEKRGRIGCHINLRELQAEKSQASKQKSFDFAFDESRFAATPIPKCTVDEHFKRYAAYMKSQGHRVTLSGVGGSEFLGDGVPSPRLELQDYLARVQLLTLARQLSAWSARMKKPRLVLLWDAIRGFFSVDPQEALDYGIPPAAWLNSAFVRRNRSALDGPLSRAKLFGALPSFQNNLRVMDDQRRLLARSPLLAEVLREVRQPFLDRDLLEFIFAVPRDQIVRVGQRRSLMKRSLVGIVPAELLNRRRKAFEYPESPKETQETSAKWPRPAEIGRHMISAELRLIDLDRFQEALRKAERNEDVPTTSLMHTLTIEFWLRHLATHGVLSTSLPLGPQTHTSSLESAELRAPVGEKV
ncbi:MAG TPA: asparagine synthase-related protein [Candidatus Bathyarchaeia archaeon]|jgi:asparagine synthase (glutamine-hydrolysing)|nr:asparagine synthase-related protein [Candidatus Bathyarchaeia archaeon]